MRRREDAALEDADVKDFGTAAAPVARRSIRLPEEARVVSDGQDGLEEDGWEG